MTVTTARLSELRTRLISLGRRRLVERWVTGWSGLVIAIVVALALAFLVDYSLRLRRIERLASLLMVCSAVLWAFRKLTRPYLAGSESLGEIALLVERRQKIDSDLVAALEFDGQLAGAAVAPEASSSAADERRGPAKAAGSPQLRAAVVEYVADFARTANVSEGENTRPMRQRLGWAAGLVVLAAAIGLVFPGHAKAFFNRFLLGGLHYPSRTRIAEMRVNEQTAVRDGVVSELAAVPEGAAVRFAVRLDGVLPELVELRIANESAARSTLLLAKVTEPTAVDTAAGAGGVWYAAEIDHLAENLWLELVAGDASTDSIPLRVSPRPVLAVELRSTPPDYARGLVASQEEAAAGSARQIAVLEGSRVELTVSCRNQELASVTLHRGDEVVELKRADGATSRWVLPDPAASPLAQVVEPLAFEIDAKNRDGVSPARRVPVLVRLLADRVPRVVAAVVTERVLPTARPSIVYGATDDLALGELKLTWQVRRTDGTVVDGVKSLRTRTGDTSETTWRGKSTFDLRPLGLVAGEEVRVTVEAVDYRGGQPGKSSAGEPIVFQVTDESGILSGLAEADERSARQLDQIIERQLGLGGSP